MNGPALRPRMTIRMEQNPPRRGRKPTTGRYSSREELVREVWHWYDLPGTSQAQVARICRVSIQTVSKILNGGRP